jgi:hypothetical protein
MIRLLIAVLIGGVLAVGAAVAVSDLATSSGPPANAQLYNYGSR